MRALQLAGIEVPQVVASAAGRDFELVEIEGLPGARQVDVFRWIPGRQLGSSEAGLKGSAETIAAQYETIGAIMARVHNHAAHWSRPAGFTRHAWDVEGLLGEQPLWGRFWELPALSQAQRALLLRARARPFGGMVGHARAQALPARRPREYARQTLHTRTIAIWPRVGDGSACVAPVLCALQNARQNLCRRGLRPPTQRLAKGTNHSCTWMCDRTS